MLFLEFRLGSDRYAIEASQVIEVLPLVAVRPIPMAPAGLAGIFDYRGTPVPLIDLSALILGEPAQRFMSTRIFLVNYREPRVLGLLAEQVTQTLNFSEQDFTTSGVTIADAPILGGVATDGGGFIRRLELGKLLTTSMKGVFAGELTGISG
jgi:chemotaxis-related protein WspB